MTIIELFPWLLSLCVTLILMAALGRCDVPTVWVIIIGLVMGVVSWLSFVFGNKRFISWLERKKTEREKSEISRRVYQAFDQAKQLPASKNLFYECCICGNVISSLSKKTVSCKCRNILVEGDSGRVEVRDPGKVKAFLLIE